MMKKLIGLTAIAAASVGCDYVPPDEEFGYNDGPSKAEGTDIGEIVVIKDKSTNSALPQRAKVNYANRTMSFASPAYGNQVVKYEKVAKDKAVGKFYVVKDGKKVDYEVHLYKDFDN